MKGKFEGAQVFAIGRRGRAGGCEVTEFLDVGLADFVYVVVPLQVGFDSQRTQCLVCFCTTNHHRFGRGSQSAPQSSASSSLTLLVQS